MHADRIDPGPSCSSSYDAARVIGLGAPVSVVIRIAPCEASLLREQLRKRVSERSRRPGDLVQDRVLAEMLADLDAAGDADIAVLWPTAFAAPILRAALDDALDAVAAASRDDDALTSLAAAIKAADAALATLRAFLAVDNGGLQQVDL